MVQACLFCEHFVKKEEVPLLEDVFERMFLIGRFLRGCFLRGCFLGGRFLRGCLVYVWYLLECTHCSIFGGIQYRVYRP